MKIDKSLYENMSFSVYRFLFLLTKFYFPKSNIVLCYHSVSDEGWRFSTKRSDFEKQMNYLSKHYNFVSLDDLITGKAKSPSVAITFDDGYKNLLQNACTVLSKYKIVPTVFVIGEPRHANRTELQNNLELLDQKDLNNLRELGWQIGYHSKTHADLATLELDALKIELDSNKSYRYFAYPRGFYSDKLISILKSSCYEAAFTVDGGVLDLSDKYKINRLPIEGNISIDEFIGYTSMYGVILSRIFLRFLQFKDKLGRLF